MYLDEKKPHLDYISSLCNENAEWYINPFIFQKIIKTNSVRPEIDLFALKLDFQIAKYVSRIHILKHL